MTFGRAIGLAFQLLDDVLDILGPAERTGKARGTDLLDGTVTLPFILARERDPGCSSSTCARSAPATPRRSATASPRPARRRRFAPRPASGSTRRSASCAARASAARS